MAPVWKKTSFDEFLRVMLSAAFLVILSRFMLGYTHLTDWFNTATWQQQWNSLIQGWDNQTGEFPSGTPPEIVNANQSVVKLSGNQSIGSGVILTSNGLVLTNSHVVENGAGPWKVRLFNEQEFPARVVATGSRDSGIFYDLAIVQIEGVANLPTARFSEITPQPGDNVWAIGAPFGKPEVITQGQVTQKTGDGILLSNTEVHPGNSGGPLLNQNGEVVGINTEINYRIQEGGITASISVPILESYLPSLMNQPVN
jgi:S1-C subfamily serine protease